MPGTKREKKKAKRKIKQKERRKRPVRTILLDKIEFLIEEAYWASEEGQLLKIIDPLEWMAALVSHMPDRGGQTVRYFGRYLMSI